MQFVIYMTSSIERDSRAGMDRSDRGPAGPPVHRRGARPRIGSTPPRRDRQSTAVTSPEPDNPPGAPASPAPHCVVVTGPARKETWAWIERKVRFVRETEPAARIAVLAADADLVRLRAMAQHCAPIEIRRLLVPCACCPGLSDLPAEAKELVDETRSDWLLIELPVLAAQPLLAHFDAVLRWPRELVVCLTQSWTEARDRGELTWHQSQLLAAADVITPFPLPEDPTTPA